MKSTVFNDAYLPEASFPVFSTVLTQALQQELSQLLASLRRQVRNVVAVGRWLARNQQHRRADEALAGQLPHLQVSRAEELSFQLKASFEAFTLFTQTLLQHSLYLHENARVDTGQQLLKIRVDFSNLEAWEYELSILFERITPATYLRTLWQDRHLLHLAERKAS